jgi:Skp family chaperone for outer membrane proteins
MFKRMLVLGMVAGALVLTGCGEKDGGSTGRVAVVDLSKIAEQIGQKSKIEEASKIRERNLQLRVQVDQQNVQAKLVAAAEEIGKRPETAGAKPTDAEKKAIDVWVGKMRQLEQGRLNTSNQIRQAYARIRKENQQKMLAEINKIRDRIRPLAQKIAKDKGLDVVITSSSVLAHSTSVDITDEVFEKVNALLAEGNFPTVTIPEQLKITRTPAVTTGPAGDATFKTPTAPKKP